MERLMDKVARKPSGTWVVWGSAWANSCVKIGRQGDAFAEQGWRKSGRYAYAIIVVQWLDYREWAKYFDAWTLQHLKGGGVGIVAAPKVFITVNILFNLLLVMIFEKQVVFC